MTTISKGLSVIAALILAGAFWSFLAFPFIFPSGVSIRRIGRTMSYTQSETIYEFESDVYRGIYFSPDGATWRRWYYETVRCRGNGTQVLNKDGPWRKYEIGVDADCIGTRFYDEGYLLIADDKRVVHLSLRKGFSGFKSSAYVNGKYVMEHDKAEPGDPPNTHSPSAQGVGGR